MSEKSTKNKTSKEAGGAKSHAQKQESLDQFAKRISKMDPNSLDWAEGVLDMMADMRGEDKDEMYKAFAESLESDLRAESPTLMSPIFLKGALDGFDFAGVLARDSLPINVQYMGQYNLTRAVLIKLRHSLTS